MVRDGEKAISYLSGQGIYADRDVYPLPALLLLDLKMPRVDGFEVLTWLRQHPSLGRMLVVVLTGSPMKEDVKQAYVLGANSYLVKPNDPSQLHDLVERLESFWLLNCARIPQPRVPLVPGLFGRNGPPFESPRL